MKDSKFPVTPAIHFLRDHNVQFVPHLFEYQEKGGTSVSSQKLGVAESIVIKTLVMQDDQKNPLIILMHGDRKVSTKELARQIKVKYVAPFEPSVADKHSGYQVGGTSPFGTKKKMPIYAEKTIRSLDRIFINGGGKGFLVEISPLDLERVLSPTWVEVAI